MAAYLLGLVTLPALVLLLLIVARSYWTAEAWLETRWGITWDLKTNRSPNIPDYTLRRDIWFERQRGPIFTGLWCRESFPDDGQVVATRWVGIGKADGRSFMVYRKRTLLADSTEATP